MYNLLPYCNNIQGSKVPIQDTCLHIYIQVVFPNPYPAGGLGMNIQHTIKIEDIQNKEEGKGLVDNAASELAAASM